MNHDSYADAYIEDVLAECRRVAIVGASANPVRPSYIVLKYFLAKGYEVVAVNPGLAGQTLLGCPVVAQLADCAAPIDLVDIFRNADAALGVVRASIAQKEALGIKAVWMQLGVRNDAAAAEAEAAGLKVIMNRCPKIEYGRLSGEIGWLGINTGMISSRRPRLDPKGIQSLKLSRGG